MGILLEMEVVLIQDQDFDPTHYQTKMSLISDGFTGPKSHSTYLNMKH